LARKQIKDIVGCMKSIFRQYKWVQIVTLINRVFVISLELIKCNDVPNGKEDEEGGKDEGDDVGKCSKGEGHLGLSCSLGSFS